jgi:hypothetical protein
MNNNHSKRDTMSIEEATISNMWEIAAIVELLEQKGLCTKQDQVGFSSPETDASVEPLYRPRCHDLLS